MGYEVIYGKNTTSPCMDCTFMPSQNVYVEILTSNGMVLGGGALRRLLGHEGGCPHGRY